MHIHYTHILIISCLKHIPHATAHISHTHTHLTVCHILSCTALVLHFSYIYPNHFISYTYALIISSLMHTYIPTHLSYTKIHLIPQIINPLITSSLTYSHHITHFISMLHLALKYTSQSFYPTYPITQHS